MSSNLLALSCLTTKESETSFNGICSAAAASTFSDRFRSRAKASKKCSNPIGSMNFAASRYQTLKHLPGVWGSDAVNKDKTLVADRLHDSIFETDAVQAMVLAAWQQYRAFTLLEIVACCLTVICLCWASYGFRHGFALSTPSLYVVAAQHLKKSLDESVQALRHLVQWLKRSANQGSYMTLDNAADTLYLVGGWLAIARQLSIGSDELEKPWMAVFAAAVAETSLQLP